MAKDGKIVEKGIRYVEWTIEDFTVQSQRTLERWTSPSFNFLNVPWFLSFGYDDKAPDESTGWVRLFLFRKETDSNVENMSVRFTLGLKARDGTLYKWLSTTHTFLFRGGGCGFPELMEMEKFVREKDKLWPDNVITIFCEIRLVGEGGVDAESQTPSQNDTVELTRSLKDAFLNGNNSDLHLKVGQRDFKVHKMILSARSTVFATMFEHDMVENRSGIVDIPDCDPDAFREFLLYLYTANMENFSESNVMSLYYIADKYDVKQLAVQCLKFMVKNISVQSFCDIITLAVKHSEPELIKTAKKFFAENVKEILVTLRWQSFMKENPTIANELFIKYATQF